MGVRKDPKEGIDAISGAIIGHVQHGTAGLIAEDSLVRVALCLCYGDFVYPQMYRCHHRVPCQTARHSAMEDTIPLPQQVGVARTPFGPWNVDLLYTMLWTLQTRDQSGRDGDKLTGIQMLSLMLRMMVSRCGSIALGKVQPNRTIVRKADGDDLSVVEELHLVDRLGSNDTENPAVELGIQHGLNFAHFLPRPDTAPKGYMEELQININAVIILLSSILPKKIPFGGTVY